VIYKRPRAPELFAVARRVEANRRTLVVAEEFQWRNGALHELGYGLGHGLGHGPGPREEARGT
jgi:hypothetical protein